ncbi:MAG TPA: hypothetical protein VNH44_00640 [Micropepsaceae bacterium]|nr:hypothetical protein [Micropepsaceae bacterium]
MAAIRAKLAGNRTTHPLFDTRRFTRNLEGAFTAMWKRANLSEAPASFVAVTALPASGY